MSQSTETLIARLVDQLEPVRPLQTRRGMVLVLAALVGACLLALAAVGMRPDFRALRPDPMALTAAGLFLVLALASAWSAIGMARPQVGLRREGWAWTAAMAAVLPISAGVLLLGRMASGEAVDQALDGTACAACGLVLALLIGAVLTAWLRRGAAPDPARAGLLVGVAAGAGGIAAVSLACPHSDLVHIGLWHGLTVVVAGALGRLIVPRLIAW